MALSFQVWDLAHPLSALPQVTWLGRLGTESTGMLLCRSERSQGNRGARGALVAWSIITRVTGGPKQWLPTLSFGTFLQQHSALYSRKSSFTKRPRAVLQSSMLLTCLASSNTEKPFLKPFTDSCSVQMYDKTQGYNNHNRLKVLSAGLCITEFYWECFLNSIQLLNLNWDWKHDEN